MYFSEIRKFYKKHIAKLILVLAAILWVSHTAYGIINYPPVASLSSGDIVTGHILDGEIINVDISDTADIQLQKIKDGSDQGLIYFSNGTYFATSSNLKIATSTSDLYIFGGRLHASSTNFGGVDYNWPASDGAANEVIQTDGSNNLSWTASSAGTLANSFTSGIAINVGDAVFVATSTNDHTSVITSSGTNPKHGTTGYGSGGFKQSFIEQTMVGRVTVWLKKTGSPTDNVRVSLRTDSTGGTYGYDQVFGDIEASSLTTSFAQYTIDFNSVFKTDVGTTYYIVFQRTGGGDAVNYCSLYGNASPDYSDGVAAYWSGSSWVEQAEDLRIELVDMLVGGYVYPASNDNYNYSENFVGFAKSTVASSTVVSVETTGEATGLLGLTYPSFYFLGNTLGSISDVAGGVLKEVGVALSATTLFIKSDW